MNESAGDAWFYTRGGERLGPMGFAELKAMAADAALDPRLDMVWKQGMAEWQAAGAIEDLFEKRAAPQPPQEALVAAAVSGALTNKDSVAEVMGKLDDWPGARRRGYIFMIFLFPAVWSLAFGFIGAFLGSQLGPEIMQSVGFAAGLLPFVAAIYFGLMRLVNLGMSRWWFLGNFVPFLNLWVGYRCFACPAGYGYHKKLDGAGVALAILYWLSLVLALLAVAVMIAVMLGAVSNPELQGLLGKSLEMIPAGIPKQILKP